MNAKNTRSFTLYYFFFFFRISETFNLFHSKIFVLPTPFKTAFVISKLTLKKKREREIKDFETEQQIKILDFRADDNSGQIST